MFTKDTIRFMAELFNGDINGLYKYKSGSDLVEFFNQYFNYDDSYRQGFPSRWSYTNDKIVEIIDGNRFNKFLDIILNKKFIARENNITAVEAAEKFQSIIDHLNKKLKLDGYYIVVKNGDFHLLNEDDDLEVIGEGGFAIVYKQKSTKLVLKKLKVDFLTDEGIRSRFKREFNITHSLKDIDGVIEVYQFNQDDYSYTMEEAEQTLSDYIDNNDLSEEIKVDCIRQILYVMGEVHDRGIIHRDISPQNVLLINGRLKMSDFGLGKDLNIFSSHRTVFTNAYGQYMYCAPEQFMMLKDGDKRSDVYSLGRLINFIMSKSPNVSTHFMRAVTEKATSQNQSFRYNDANSLLKAIEKSIEYNANSQKIEIARAKMQNHILDEDVENYIYELDGVKLCKEILNTSYFITTLLSFIKGDEIRTLHFLELVSDNYRDVCGRTFTSYDSFAIFAHTILTGEFSFVAKERSASILNHVAYGVNRFSAQQQVDDLIDIGIDPLLEEILK
ncbi:serine/threonine protein kinase [Lutibacter sp. B2]|nr:serine/threonine protein kinase [Lutibacter sp. B2]